MTNLRFFFQNAGVETDGHNLLIATPSDPQLDEFIRTKNPHLFIDEYSAVIARKAQFSATLNNYLKNIPQSNYMWITVDIKQSLDAASEGNYLAEEMTNVSMKTEKHLLTVHRCVDNVFQQYRHHCDINVQLGHQLKGPQIEKMLIDANFLSDFIEQVTTKIKAWREKGYQQKDICIVFSFLDGPACKFLFMVFMELHSMKLGIEILFQCETLSQEWPVVIVCGKIVILLCYSR